MIDPQEILASYNTLISGQSTQVIKNAELSLKELYGFAEFLTINKAILMETQLSIHIKKMSAVHLGQFIKKNKRNNVVAADVMVKEYLEMFCNQKLQQGLKVILMPQLEEIISDEANQSLRTVITTSLLHNLTGDSVNYIEAVCVGQALIGLKANPKEVKQIIITTFERYCTLATQLHYQLPKATQKMAIINNLSLIRDFSKLIQSFIARIGLMDVQTSKLLYSAQLADAVRTAFELSIPGNSFAFNLYFSIPNEEEITMLVNFTKKNYLSILAAFLRIVAGSNKNSTKLATNLLYTQSGWIIEYCLQATADLLQNQLYYQLPKQSLLVQCLFQALGLTITALRNNDFYQTFHKHRTDLVEKILIPCLCLSPADVDEFYSNHSEFVERVLQVVDKEEGGQQRKPKIGEQQEVQLFDTLKTYAGECVSVLCKYQDAVLSQIFEFTMNILQGKMGCPYPRSVFLLIITLLKPRLTNRPDFQTRLAIFLVSFLKETTPPQMSQEDRKEVDIEYALLLLAVAKFSPDLTDLNGQILPISFQRGVNILSGNGNEVYKALVFELFDQVNRLQNGEDYALDLLKLYNTLLAKDPSNRLLDSYSQLLQFNLQYFQAHSGQILTGIFIICKYVEQELKKPQPTQLFLNKSFNVVREIGESSIYLPQLIPQLEQAVLPLLPYIDGRQEIDLEEDILLMLAAFLQHGKSVTVAQQEMFSIIPKVFYNQYHCTFGQAFTTVHSFIYYGASLLSTSPQAVQAIIEMSIASMTLKECNGNRLSEIDNCEGVFILQSLVLACGTFLGKEIWIAMLNKVVERLSTPIATAHLTANLLGLLSLSLTHTQNIFSSEQNMAMLTPILSGVDKCCKVKWARKVLAAGLSQLMVNLGQEFIKNNFRAILESVLNLLQCSTTKLSLLDASIQSLQDQEFDYDNLIQLTKNNLKLLDEFTFFRQQFAKLLTNNRETVMEVVEQLPNPQKDFLNRVLSTQKVSNQPRNIFKIKR